MKFRFLAPLLVAALFDGMMLLFVVSTLPYLPDLVAVHFDSAGTANGWMTRDEHLRMIIGLNFGLQILFIFIFLVTKALPARFINLPHRDYWLAPERKEETCTRLSAYGLWFSAWVPIFVGGVHALIIHAHRFNPPSLGSVPMYWVVLGVLLVPGCWTLGLMLWLYRVPGKK